jgi:acyl-coenzyme A synthetase/AMP-(fatty) acid ligase
MFAPIAARRKNLAPPKNIGLLFDWHATRARTTRLVLDRPFDIDPDGRLQHDADSLAQLVRDASGWLHAVGVKRGDRVAVIKENHFDMILLSAAAARIGALAATISAANPPEHLMKMLERVCPSALVTSSNSFAGFSSDAAELLPRCTILLLDSPSVPVRNGIRIKDLRGAPVPSASFRDDSEAMMITHTSGTTGVPKLVVHTANSNRGATRLELLPLPFAVSGRRDVVLSSISFAHSRAYTWAIAQLRWAPSALSIASSHELADVERLLDARRPTMVESTPNVFQYWLPLVERRPELFARVRYYLNTFDLMHPAIARPFLNASQRRLVLWAHSWGQSEVGPIAGSAYFRPQLNRLAGSARDHMNNMGWPWPGLLRLTAVHPETKRPVRRGEIGLLLVRSKKSLCVDYLGEHERHESQRTGQWWDTGDLGYFDRLGRVHFVDRSVDAVPGMSATELESVLLQRLPAASEVILLPRGEREPVPVVCVDDAHLTEETWKAATNDLPAIASPVILRWDQLPRTSTWKVRRKELRSIVLGAESDIVGGQGPHWSVIDASHGQSQ